MEKSVRELPQMERKKRRQKRRMFFLGGQPELWRTLMDEKEKAHPDSLPLGMPLLNPLLLLQVLLPPICKISILYFLNEQGRETSRKGFFRQHFATGLEVSAVCFYSFFKCAKATRHGKGNKKIDASVHTALWKKKQKGYFSSSLLTIMFLRPWFRSEGDVF